MLHGRGGSVSRRDLDQAYRRPPVLAWVRKSEETHKPIPSHSSGGGPGEALLLEKRPPPEFSPRSHPSYAFITASAIWAGSVTAV